MKRETDSSDTLTLTHELKLKIALTVVSPRTDTLKVSGSVSEVSNVVSVKCQYVGVKLSEREVSEKRQKKFYFEG